MSSPDSPRFAFPAHIAETFAYLVLRLWLGLRALLTGVEKYAGVKIVEEPLLDEFGEPDINGAMVEVKTKVYGMEHYHGLPPALADKFAAEPLLPGWSLGLFDILLGPALIVLGITLLIGLAPRLTLFLQGLLYSGLTVGLVLLNESGGIAWLGLHVLLVVIALRLVQHDRFSVLPRW
jgi:thiosulfate dehydrogenase [quinone] large subunit